MKDIIMIVILLLSFLMLKYFVYMIDRIINKKKNSEDFMIFISILILGIICYLFYALINPEKF